MPIRYCFYIPLLSLLLLSPINLLAIDNIKLDINKIFPINSSTKLAAPFNKDIHQWLINKLSISIKNPFTEQPQLILKLSDIQVTSGKQTKTHFKAKLSCIKFNFSWSKIECKSGRLSIDNNTDKALAISAVLSFVYDISLGQLSLKISQYQFAGTKGQLSLNYSYSQNKTDGIWNIISKLSNLDIQQLNKWLKVFQPNNKDLDKITGVISFDIQSSGNHSGLFFVNLKTKTKQLNIELQKDDFEILTEKLNSDSHFILNKHQSNYKLSLDIQNTQGLIFVDPYYIELTGIENFHIKANTDIDNYFDLDNFKIVAGKVFNFNANMRYHIKTKTISDYSLHANSTHLKKFQTAYLDNLLSGTLFEGLQIAGHSKLKLSNKNKISNVVLDLNNVDLALAENSFVNINSRLLWTDSFTNEAKNISPDRSKVSNLSWDKITYNKMNIGKTEFKFLAQKDQINVAEQIRVPIFDGRLIINNLKLSNIFKSLELDFDGVLEPVSMSLISQQLEWPVLHGKLSALIPHTSYTHNKLLLGGQLWFNLFDGTFSFDNIIITEPMTDYSHLTGDITINNISLAPLTKTFDFGNMQGRVGGYVNNLVLDNWQPSSFDMFIGTQKNDNSRHTISQQAVDNLSSMGGMSGLLSQSFMSFFENFHYDKLGIGCSLYNGRCTMRGIEDDQSRNAYYIVKGGGIPRIDIMGYEKNVDWHTLLERLKSVQQSNQEAVIK